MKSAFFTLALLLAAFTLRAQLPTGCVAYYPFNGNLKDSTKQGTNGTNHGAKFTTDRYGHSNMAMAFDGDNTEYIDLGSTYTYSTLTIAAWIKPENGSAGTIFLSNFANITQFQNTGLELQLSHSGEIQVQFGNVSNSPSSYRTVIGKTILNYDEWYHVVVTIGSMSEVKIYLNGTLDKSSTVSTVFFKASEYNMYAGVRSYPANEAPFYGSMDELMIFTRVLAPSEVSGLYEVPNPIAAFNASNVCQGKLTHFTDNSEPKAASLTYLWNFGDNTTSTNSSPSHRYASPGIYTVILKVTNIGGKSDSASKEIIVFPAAYSSFKTTINAKTVTFAPTDSTLDSYAWDFGDSSLSYAKKPAHTYTWSGSYTVKLTTRNKFGCDSTTSQVITVSTSGINKDHGPELQVLLYPNPVTYGELNLEIQSGSGDYQLHISDMQGRECHQEKIPAGADGIRKTISLQGYKSGMYFVTITSAEGVYYEKVVVR